MFIGRKKYKIKRRIRDLIEPEEIFLDAKGLLGISNESLDDLEKTKIETPINFRIILAVFILIGVSFSVLLANSFYLQAVRGGFYIVKSEKNKTQAFSLRPLRGVIYDRLGAQLIFNEASFDLVAIGKELPQDPDVLKAKSKNLAVLLNINESEFFSTLEKIRLTGSLSPLVLKSGINLDVVLAIESGPEEFPGIGIEKNAQRIYPWGFDFSHLLGYLGKTNKEELESITGYSATDYIGKDGLELFYEDELRGRPGKISFEVDARQNIKREAARMPEGGNNLVLTIDKDLTLAGADILKRNIANLGLKRGAAVIEDPRTGEILALISLPGFDINQFSKSLTQEEYNRIFNNPDNPMFNRAVSGAYPIGSTIKPLIAAAALEEKIISPDKKIRAPARIEIPNPYFPDKPSIFKDWRDHGWVSLKEAIAWSSNVYFYNVGGGLEDVKGLGIERIKKYAELFGLKDKTGIDLPGEVRGFFPDPAWKKKANIKDPLWRVGDTYNVSIGQGEVLATPLQVANYISSIANGGSLFKPMVVKKITDEDGLVIEEKKTEILRSGFVSADNLKIIREGMRQAVTDGSAQALNYLPFQAAGKTGTAQYNNNTKSHAWFAGFAPYDNPEIV
ncbi:MAG: penicillin-binding protein 2, partial [bacterium]|nr:penicillin-binding protein 2 [bacterium]